MRTTVIALAILSATYLCNGEEPETLEQILKARDAVLTQILQEAKNRHTMGLSSLLEIEPKTVTLYSFRRDCTVSLAERVHWQEKIVALEAEAKKELQQRVAAGSVTQSDLLLAEERYLSAKQKLIELRARQ